jgi:hypothetical protein
MSLLPSQTNRPRRMSRPITSRSRSGSFGRPVIGSPRPPLPQDANANAITYDAKYLDQWAMDSKLWEEVPEKMHQYIKDFQHAGAAALTSFERLDKLKEAANGKVVDTDNSNDDQNTIDNIREIRVERTPSLSSMPSLSSSNYHSRSASLELLAMVQADPSSPFDAEPAMVPNSPAVGEKMSPLDITSSPSLGSYFSPTSKEVESLDEHSGELAKAMAGLDTGINPPKLGTRRDTISSSSSTTTQENYVPPASKPIIHRWRAELDHLKSETIVKLRHSFRKITVEWRALQATEEYRADHYYESTMMTREKLVRGSITPPSLHNPENWNRMVIAMDRWIWEKNELVHDCEKRAEGLHGWVVLGWGTKERPSRRESNFGAEGLGA